MEDAIYNFISSTIKEIKYCNDVMKNILTKNFKRKDVIMSLENIEVLRIEIVISMLI